MRRSLTIAFVAWLCLTVAAATTLADSETFKALDLGEPPEPRPAPDFALPSLSGGAVALKDFRGKPVLIHFWTTWCQPCKTELPLLERFHREHKGRATPPRRSSGNSSRRTI